MPSTTQARPALRPFTTGAAIVLGVGLGHTAITAFTLDSGPKPGTATAAAVDAMTRAVSPVGGLDRSLHELYVGFALVTGLAPAAFGALALVIARTAPEVLGRSRGPALVGAAFCALALPVSVALLPLPPIVGFGIALPAFVVAARRAGTGSSAKR